MSTHDSNNSIAPEQFLGAIVSQQQDQTAQNLARIQNTRAQLDERIAQRKQRLADTQGQRSRDGSELITDTAAALSRGVVDLGQILYGGLDLFSQAAQYTPMGQLTEFVAEKVTGEEQQLPTLDESSRPIVEDILGGKGTITQQFGKSRDIIDRKLLSEPTEISKRIVAEQAQKRSQNAQTEVDKLIEKGHSELLANVLVESKSFTESIGDYIENPKAALDAAIQSVPQLFVGGAVGKSAVNARLAKMTPQQAKAFAASPVGKKELTRLGERAGIATTAVQEGLSNGVEAKAQVLDMSFEELKQNSPAYNELIKEGKTPEQARTEIANTVMQQAASISALIAGGVSKVTGAGSFEGNLFTKNSKLSNIFNEAIGVGTDTLREGVEETLQSGGGQFAQNLAIKTNADETQRLADNIGNQAGAGLVAGALSGGSVSGATRSANIIGDVVSESTAPITEAVQENKKVTDALQSEETTTKALDPTDSDYDAEVAFDVAIQTQAPKAETQKHLDNLREETIAALEKSEELPTETQEQKDIQEKALVDANRKLQIFTKAQERFDALEASQSTSPVQAQDTVQKAIEGNKEAEQELLGSVPNLSVEQLQQISDSPNTSERISTYARNHLATRQAQEIVEDFSSDKVHDDIITGSKGFKGIKEYQQAISNYVSAGDKDSARNELKRFTDFIKNHILKTQAITQAYNALVNNDPKAQQLIDKVQKDYNFEVHRNTNKNGLIDLMNLEVDLLKAARKESLHLAQSTFAPVTAQPQAQSQTVAPEVDAGTVQEINQTQQPVSTEAKGTVTTPTLKEQVTTNEAIKSNFTVKTKKSSMLHTVPDLFRSLRDSVFNREPLTEEQNQAVDKIIPIEQKLSDSIDKSIVIKPKDTPYLDRDYVQNLVDDDGVLNANVKSTIALVVADWLGTQGTKTLYNKDSDINSILGNEDEASVSDIMVKLLAKVGTTRTNLAETLGKQIVRSLGLTANEDADGTAQSKLELSTGLLAIRAMQDAGLVTLSEIPNKTLNKFRDDPVENPKGNVVFVRIATESDGKYDRASKEVSDIIETIKNDDGLLDTLFGIGSFKKAPRLRAPKNSDVVEDVKGSFNKVPARIRKLIAKHQKRPVRNKRDVARPFLFLSDENRLKVAGANLDYENNTHVTVRESQEAINENLQRSIDNFVEHNERTKDKPFYFMHYITKNMRMMLDSNTVNPQGDKLHRHLMGYQQHEVEIDPNNPDHMIQFYTAVAEALSIGVDKMSPSEVMNEFTKIATDPVIQKAIDAINEVNTGRFEEGQPTADRGTLEDDIVAGVLKGGENVYSLDGLVALANYKKANGKPFKTSLFREVDGITNGVAIGSFQLAAAGDFETLAKQLERTGMFFDNTTNWSDWYKNPLNNDAYQDMAIDWIDQLDSLENDVLQNIDTEDKKRKSAILILKGNINSLPAIRELVGSFLNDDNTVSKLARNLTKNPLMITNYGAATKKVRNQFSEKILAKFYEDITKAALDNNQSELDRLAYQMGQVLNTPLNINTKNALEFTLLSKQETQFRTYVDAFYGQALEGAIESKYGDFIKKRTELNKALQLNFHAFYVVYQRRLKEETKKKGQELNRDQKLEIVRELQKLVPSFKSPMAEFLNDSIVVMKDKKVRRTDTDSKVEVTFSGKAKTTAMDLDRNGNIITKDKYVKSANTNISEFEYEDGGVSGVILGIHSIDAATMFGLLDQYTALNVHDAAAFSLLEVLQGTEALNASFVNVLQNFNMREEVQNSLVRAIKELRKNRGDVAEFMVAVRKAGLLDKDTNMRDFLAQFNAGTQTANKLRQEVLDKLTHVQQYNPGNGGHYTVNAPQSTSNLSQQAEKVMAKSVAKEALKSAKRDLDPENFGASAVQQVNQMNQEAVFTALGKTGNVKDSPDHTAHLASLLTRITANVTNPIKLQLRKLGNETYGAQRGKDVFINVGMGTLVNGTQMSAQETYVHEIVHMVTRAGVDSNNKFLAEIKRLFKSVEKQIKPEDFLNRDDQGNILDLHGNVITAQSAGYASELAAATERYDYIFNNSDVSANNRNSYLHEFIAIGLTNKAFRNALSKISGKTEVETVKDESIIDKIQNMFANILSRVFDQIRGTKGLQADQKLMILAERLANIDSRKKSVLYKHAEKAQEFTKDAIIRFIVSPLADFASRTKVPIISTAGKVVKQLPHVDATEFGLQLSRVARRMGYGKDNFISELLTEAQGATKNNNVFHVLLRKSVKMIDQARAHTKGSIHKQLNAAFKTDLNKQDKIAITKAILKTDLSAVMGLYNWDQMKALFGNTDFLNKEIIKLENQLSQFKGRVYYYRKMANSLGHYMATGIALEQQQPYNAFAIANEDGTGNMASADASQAVDIIDQLATLRAIQYTDSVHKDLVSKVIERELKADPVNNGISFLVQLHDDYKKRALDSLFGGNQTPIQKGYTKEIYNPNITVIIAPLSEESALLHDGYYKVGEPLPQDPDSSITEPVYRYVSKDGLQTTYESGIASTTNRTAKGTDLIAVYAQHNDNNPHLSALNEGKRILKLKQRRAQNIYKKDVTASQDVKMLPIFDDQGEVAGYRYMMSEKTKDTILEKDNSFDNVFGAMEASIIDKVNTVKINNELIKLTKKDFDEKYSSNPNNYVVVGKNATKEEYRELYRLFPQEMRDEIHRVWGQDNVYVPEELVTMLFGRRKWSLANALPKTKTFRTFAEKMNSRYAVNTLRTVAKAERIWQEAVKLVKDLIVIKSGIVMLGNMTSNLVLLKTYGVSLQDIARDHSRAIKYANQIKRDQLELEALENEIKVNPNATNIQRKKVQIARLKNSIETNPVKELIDAGVYQSIIEDVEVEDEQFTYKSKLQEYLTPKYVAEGKVPKVLTDIGHNLVISHETKLYQFLRDTTQMSDFVARYTLHQHNLKKGMSKDESLKNIVDAFVNYDLHTNKYIQYANDVGLVMFSKFFIRIQKVIWHLASKHTANFVGLIMLQNLFDTDVEDIFDSVVTPDNMLNKMYNPMDIVGNLLDVPLVNFVDGVTPN